MNILLLGSGGREHALAWKLSQSNLCSNLYVAPGNTGTATCAINIPFSVTDVESIKTCCRDNKIDLLVIGPEDPLVMGLVDILKADPLFKDLLIIGPSKDAAQLEGSKAYAKGFMKRHHVPTAAYAEFTLDNYNEGVTYLQNHSLPVVLKANGLAAGKGVLICTTHEEALKEFELMIKGSKFGAAGDTVVIEQFLSGIELSMFALTDGNNYVLLPEAKDYKRIGEGDTGLNTGGMGAISPVPFATAAFINKVKEQIIEPTVKGIITDGLDYKGFIFFGLIKVGEEPFVIEYNCRMGDPETEVVMPRIQSDLVALLVAAAKGRLEDEIKIDPRYATTIVAVSGGYPNEFKKGYPIKGIQPFTQDELLFHAGTKLSENNEVVTNGGRVLCATAMDESLTAALDKSRSMLQEIHFDNMYYRNDIGFEFI